MEINRTFTPWCLLRKQLSWFTNTRRAKHGENVW